MMANFSKRQFAEAALLVSATLLLAGALRTGDVQRGHSIQCPVAPNGKPYLAPGC
jgi:hypothetical protein